MSAFRSDEAGEISAKRAKAGRDCKLESGSTIYSGGLLTRQAAVAAAGRSGAVGARRQPEGAAEAQAHLRTGQ